MARASLVAAAVVLLASVLGLAAAQGPCIECKDCKTNNCFQFCKPQCASRPPPRPPVRPDQVIVNGQSCQNAGSVAGGPVSTDACDTTRKFCRGGRSAAPTRAYGAFATTLSQCSNIALGTCQQAANNAARLGHPCGRELRLGLDRCTARSFRDFYEGETRELCTNAARSITGVNPGTNQWANGNSNRPPRPVASGSVAANPSFG